MSSTVVPRRIVVAMTGASGQIYGIRLLEMLRSIDGIETHLILSGAARMTISLETAWDPQAVEALGDVVHRPTNVGASIASGSFATQGMVIAPCSIKTLSAVAQSYSGDLITRAADVHLKEGRPLLLMVRETPLHLGHLRLMAQAAESGAVIYPPIAEFYSRPASINDLVDNFLGRVLNRLGISNEHYHAWPGAGARDPGSRESS